MEREAFEKECYRRFKKSSNDFIELMNGKDIRDTLMSLFEAQSEINRLKEENERLKNGHAENLLIGEAFSISDDKYKQYFVMQIDGLKSSDLIKILSPKEINDMLSQNKH